ncbi:hypothetical protein PILCRDRAFT_810704 [Piloderma croceum F 1598]|uniref:Uncharacterized protein n=1 Tax=Piloderma croceum (strain F 1598) TaxID=765440 RepID=A0A0C3CNW9_PILCF|nr:hypothetical protein PILCRDRAFT_810704 [Piloderma croceum F 1598]
MHAVRISTTTSARLYITFRGNFDTLIASEVLRCNSHTLSYPCSNSGTVFIKSTSWCVTRNAKLRSDSAVKMLATPPHQGVIST